MYNLRFCRPSDVGFQSFLLPCSCLVRRQLENAASDSFPDIDEVLVWRHHQAVHQLRPLQVHLVHPLVLQLGDAHLDVFLDGLHVPVQFLPITSLVFKSGAWKLLEVLGAPDVLRVVVAAG